MDEEGSKHPGLKVTWANQRVIRAFEKGNQTKALSLIRDYLCSDWHPRANDVRAIGVEIRAWIQHGVEPGKCEELERLAMGSRQRMKALGGTLAMLWKQEETSQDWLGLVRDAVFNSPGLFVDLCDCYYMIYFRQDSMLLDKFQQMANLQLAHLNIPSQFWGHDYGPAISTFQGLKLSTLKGNHLSFLLSSLTQVSQLITENNAPLGGDEFIVLFQWVIMRSKLSHSWSLLCLLRDWVADTMGIAAYTVATFEVALTSLQEFSIDEATRNAEECLQTNVNIDHFPKLSSE